MFNEINIKSYIIIVIEIIAMFFILAYIYTKTYYENLIYSREMRSRSEGTTNTVKKIHFRDVIFSCLLIYVY